MGYSVYVLRSEKDGKLYIGHTNCLVRRLKEHAAGKVPSTRSRRPLRLVYVDECKDRRESVARERYYKTTKGRRELRKKITPRGPA
jgi:putative endonuclease